jgi:ABC-type branched-subunit amino acid transport system ATPase component
MGRALSRCAQQIPLLCLALSGRETALFATDNLSVQFGATKALQDVTMTCATNVVGIAGANGAGKSTLLNVFCGYLKPTRGRVRLRGADCTGRGPGDMARLKVGRVAQHPELSRALTVWENASMGARGRASSRRVTELFDSLQLTAWARRDVSELPYSVQKLLDLVRAMAPEPDVLLCDEPFSGLDSAERDRAQAVLSSVAKSGTMLVVVEHDVVRLASMVDQLLVLENGRVLADGPPDAVLERGDVVSSFIGGSLATAGSAAEVAGW